MTSSWTTIVIATYKTFDITLFLTCSLFLQGLVSSKVSLLFLRGTLALRIDVNEERGESASLEESQGTNALKDERRKEAGAFGEDPPW